MAVTFQFERQSDRRVVAFIRTNGADLKAVVNRKMEKLMIRLARQVKTHLKGGNPLHMRSGNLFNSIQSISEIKGDRVLGRVFVGKEASKYGFVHEYGGTFQVKAYMRHKQGRAKPKMVRFKGRMMPESGSFGKTNEMVMVRAHSATYPERSFMRVASKEMQQEILQELKMTVVAAMKGKKA